MISASRASSRGGMAARSQVGGRVVGISGVGLDCYQIPCFFKAGRK